MYIYLKTHRVTGLKYLGITKRDPFKYKGSGKYWKQHIIKHGYDVETEILFETECQEELERKCLYYSEYFDVVYSNDFANLIPESGRSNVFSGKLNPFFGKKHSEETKQKISQSKMGQGIGFRHTDNSKEKMSKSKKGVSVPKPTLRSSITYTFIHKNGNVFTGTQYDFIKAYDLSDSHTYSLVKGNRKSHKGWKLMQG